MQINHLEEKIWQQLLRASVDKHHEWRSPVLVTCGADNWPDARVVILRTAEIDTKILTFYTDSRSPKVTQIAINPQTMLIFWSKRLNWQLRVKANITIKTSGEDVQKVWHKVKQNPSANDYLSTQTPGETMKTEYADFLYSATPHFAILQASVQAIDWLELNRNGHQRAKIDSTGLHLLVP